MSEFFAEDDGFIVLDNTKKVIIKKIAGAK